ncbi:MAG TPA: TspO/MBR family protein [bacterium]|nr:TspO/MBR family protein [bacterium]
MKWNLLQLIAVILLCQAAGGLGAIFTAKAIPVWYAGLRKPSFNPPNWVFGPVWTLLYTLMGIALYRVWKLDPQTAGRSLGLLLFFIQLGLNALWTPLFFGLHALWPAFVEILLMWAAILLTAARFYQLDPVSAWLLAPYLAWVTFAGLLNFAYAKLNP